MAGNKNRLQVKRLPCSFILSSERRSFRKAVSSFINSGNPRDTNSKRLWEFPAQGWILDGIPETREQAMMIQTLGITPRHVSE